MICQLRRRSVTFDIHRVNCATSRGRWHQFPSNVGALGVSGVPSVAAAAGAVSSDVGPALGGTNFATTFGAGPSSSYSNLFMITGDLPRDRKITANAVSGI